MIVYSMAPIDFWSGWQKPHKVFKVNTGPERVSSYDHHDAAEWDYLWEKAQSLARHVGWYGDIRVGPLVTVLPPLDLSGGDPPVVLAWKDENGGTFIASPVRLPWIDTYANEVIEG